MNANKGLFANLDRINNICIRVVKGSQVGGFAEPKDGSISITEEVFKIDETGKAAASIITHEFAHILEGPFHWTRDHYYHPDLLKDVEYRRMYDLAKNKYFQATRNDLNKLKEQTSSSKAAEISRRNEIELLIHQIALSAPDLLSKSDLRSARSGFSIPSISPRRSFRNLDQVHSFAIDRMNAIAQKRGIPANAFDEFNADRVSFQLLKNTRCDPSKSFQAASLDGDSFRSVRLGSREYRRCRASLNSGVPEIFSSNTHPSICRRYYEAMIKMPQCYENLEVKSDRQVTQH